MRKKILAGMLVALMAVSMLTGCSGRPDNAKNNSAANNHSKQLAVAFGGVADIILVAGGYFICELPMYGIGAAASIPSNIIQGVSGLIIASILYPLLNPALKPLLYNER